jgi:hypothetical protein
MPATSYKIRGIAPPDLANYDPATRKMFWGWVVLFGIKAKVADLMQGLDKDGRPLRPILPRTRKYRRSAMTASGKGDPGAPPLIPAHMRSRTISLLDGRALSTHADFFWRFDAWTGASWGDVLAIQSQHGRDVIGLSRASTAKVQAQALRKWADWKAGRHVEDHAVVVKAAALAVPQVGRMNVEHATFGLGGAGLPAFVNGKWTGGMTAPEWAAYFRQSARVNIPGRPNPAKSPHPNVGAGYNRLLAHVWSPTNAGPGKGVIRIPAPIKPTPTRKAALPPKVHAMPKAARPVEVRRKKTAGDAIGRAIDRTIDFFKRLFGKK